jgi:LPXTG-motif cell wall-anchored protein
MTSTVDDTSTPFSAFSARSATALLGAVLTAGALLVPAASAFADAPASGTGGAGVTVVARTPAAVGFAGQPVGFTETVTNTGAARSVILALEATTGVGVEQNSLVIQYQDGGTWKDLALDYSAQAGTFTGQTGALTLAAGSTTTLKLRIGLPMGTPHNGDSNGGAASIKLRSSVAAADGSWVLLAQDTHTIAVDSISSGLVGVPTTATAGGAPIEFTATLNNPTPSDYTDLGDVIFVNDGATVQVRTAGGSWTTLPPVIGPQPELSRGFYLGGRNSSSAAGSDRSFDVRVSFPAGAPLGTTHINPCLFVNEGSTPFEGTTMCTAGVGVKIVAAAQGSTSPTATPTSPSTSAATPTGTATSTGTLPTDATPTPSASAPGALAATGASGSTSYLALGGGAFLLVGGAGLLVAGRRRSSS